MDRRKECEQHLGDMFLLSESPISNTISPLKENKLFSQYKNAKTYALFCRKSEIGSLNLLQRVNRGLQGLP